MRKFLCAFLTAVLVLGLCACGNSQKNDEAAAAPDAGFQVGFGRRGSMPTQYPVHIAGNDAGRDKCEGSYLDELSVTCVAMKQGDQTVLVFSCDIVDIDGAFYKTTENAVATAVGLPVENVILNATHTHSAPTLKENLPGKDAYLLTFNSACVSAAQDALADLSPATVSYGSIQTEHMVRVRHYLMLDGSTYGNGHGNIKAGIKEHHYASDEEAQVVRFTRAAEDKKDIVLMNLGAHGTMVNGTQGMLSADFPGVARQYVEEQEGVLCAYFIAAAGDQTPSSKIPGEVPNGNDYKAYGTQYGEYIVKCLQENMVEGTVAAPRLYTETYTAKRMKEGTDDPVQMQHAQEIVNLKTQYGTYSNPTVSGKVAEYGFSSYYEASGLITRSKAPQTGTLPVTAMTVGNIGFVFASYEMFSTHGTSIKENSPMDMTFVITCSEDDKAYIPNDIACEHSYYEYDITPYARGTGQALADRYVEILTALKDGATPAAQQMP